MPATLLYQEKFRVRFYELEPHGRASPATMCRFAQEAADGHCRTIQMSLLEARAIQRMWVLTRFRLRMERYPEAGEEVLTETWASSRTNGIRAVREFSMVDSEGMVIGHANSIWLLLDVNRKRAVRLPQAVLDLRNPERSDEEEFEFPRLQGPVNAGSSRVFDVGWKELDSNEHANNVNYVDWALETVPLEMRRDRRLAQLDVEFLAETFYGDQVCSEVELVDGRGVHSLRNGAGRLLALALTRWE